MVKTTYNISSVELLTDIVGNASYSVGFPSAQIPADMMFART
jgi:hypothetical protein